MTRSRTVYLVLGICFLAACKSYDSFDEMAQAMCAGSVPDIVLSEAPADAVIIDVRSDSEWQVSHLEQAIHAEWDGSKFNAMPQLDPERPIVVYCSVGYRSEKAGEYLMQLGYAQVYNLYGGLFKVYNENVAPSGSHQVLQQIHGYNSRWGKWITRGGVRYD